MNHLCIGRRSLLVLAVWAVLSHLVHLPETEAALRAIVRHDSHTHDDAEIERVIGRVQAEMRPAAQMPPGRQLQSIPIFPRHPSHSQIFTRNALLYDPPVFVPAALVRHPPATGYGWVGQGTLGIERAKATAFG